MSAADPALRGARRCDPPEPVFKLSAEHQPVVFAAMGE
jgi:hypothetical protein